MRRGWIGRRVSESQAGPLGFQGSVGDQYPSCDCPALEEHCQLLVFAALSILYQRPLSPLSRLAHSLLHRRFFVVSSHIAYHTYTTVAMSQEFTYSDISEHNTKKVSIFMDELLDARKRRAHLNGTRIMRVLDTSNNQSSNT